MHGCSRVDLLEHPLRVIPDAVHLNYALPREDTKSSGAGVPLSKSAFEYLRDQEAPTIREVNRHTKLGTALQVNLEKKTLSAAIGQLRA